MQHVIIVIHLMVVAALVALVLYQKSEGGALGLGSSGFMTGRGQANALTRATGILGTIFFLTSIALTVLPAWQRGPGEGGDWTKAIDQGNIQLKEVPPPGAPTAPDAAKDGKESIFEQLQRAQEQRQKAGAPTTPPAAASQPTPAPKPAEAPKAEIPPSTPPAAPAEAEKPALRPSNVESLSPEPAKQPEAKAPAAEAAPAPSRPAAYAPSWLRPQTPQSETPKSEAPKSEAPKLETPKAEAPTESKPAANQPTIWKAPTQ
jgi:protein translocase SecG subunit